jgi:tRNA (cmo5U34)-methyltransferase
MSVASHLHIRLEEYDSRIQTFIPGYDEMLDVAAQALRMLDRRSPHLIDLGTGTGALAARCLGTTPEARVTAVDADSEILALAGQRLAALGADASFVCSRFDELTLPPCDAIVASLSLHHIRTAAEKRRLYERCRAAVGVDGLLISADCCPARDERLASA